jgi:hypothetical protein
MPTTPSSAAEWADFLVKNFQPADLEKVYNERSTKSEYFSDPIGYAEKRLGVRWWSKQKEAALSILNNQKTLVKASHSVGKTFLGGGLVLWWYETRNPSISLTTAPTEQQVKDLLWREIRAQAPPGIPLAPKAPRIEPKVGDPKHYASGLTARDKDAFQGRHEDYLLIGFDECVGIDSDFWIAAEGMVTGPNNRWFGICNPTDSASAAYLAEQSGDWNVITISAMEHPNIAAELKGEEPPFPKAVRLQWIMGRIKEWCTQVNELKTGCFEFPPGSGLYYQPGALFESRVLGRWPSQSINSIWSDAMLEMAFRKDRPQLVIPKEQPVEFGCDVARFGDDNTTIHVRQGPCSLYHEANNGWSTSRTANRLRELAREWGRSTGVDGSHVPIKIDDSGVGGGVVDQAQGYRFIPINGAHKALIEEEYPNRRSEMWFATAQRSLEADRLDFTRVSENYKQLIRAELMTPTWRLDNMGRRVVEPKAETKHRLKRSPDNADAVNLAYAPARLPIDIRPVYKTKKPSATVNWQAQRSGYRY